MPKGYIYILVLHKFFYKIKKIEIKRENIHPLIYEANKKLNLKPDKNI